jgi:hypothetical protein
MTGHGRLEPVADATPFTDSSHCCRLRRAALRHQNPSMHRRFAECGSPLYSPDHGESKAVVAISEKVNLLRRPIYPTKRRWCDKTCPDYSRRFS